MKPSESSFDPIGKWPTHATSEGHNQYGDRASYLMAAGFLDGLPVVEDWGCGTAFGRQFYERSRYIGVDGSGGKFCDAVDDVRTRDSQPDGIQMRHVLEHNPEWERVLQNAIRCFKHRMALITYLPFQPETVLVDDPGNGIPCIWFRKEDLLKHIRPLRYLEVPIVGNDEVAFLIQK